MFNAKFFASLFSIFAFATIFMSAAPAPESMTIVTLRGGTVITAEVIDEVVSSDLEVGNIIRMEVRGNVTVNGKVVIADGAMAEGKVLRLQKDCAYGKPSIQITLETVQAVDGQRVRLRGTAQKATAPCECKKKKKCNDCSSSCNAVIRPGTSLNANVLSDININA